MERKLRVLLIPDRIQWILGTIAREIVKWNPDIDFTILSEAWIERYVNEPASLFESFDVIHFISPYVYSKYKNFLKSSVTVSSIHHVLDWEKVKDNILADIIVVGSTEWRDYLLNEEVPDTKILHVPYGVDTEIFSPPSKKTRSRLRRKSNMDENSIVLGFFSKFSSNAGGRKGIDTMIESLRILRQKTNRGIVVVVTGPGWDELADDFSKYGIRCFYPGFIPKYESMKKMYDLLNFYLITARIEGGPITMLEAMSCKIPVITTPVGMARDIVRDGYNALLIPKDNPQATAEKMFELINYPDLSSKIAENGRNTILDSYSWKNSLKKMPEIYQKAMKLHHKGNYEKRNSVAGNGNERSHSRKFRQSRIFLQEELLWLKILSYMGQQRLSKKIKLRLFLTHPFSPVIWEELMKTHQIFRFAERLVTRGPRKLYRLVRASLKKIA